MTTIVVRRQKVNILLAEKFTLELAMKVLDRGGWSVPYPGCFTPGIDLVLIA